jgi:hypothetical protein
MQGTQRFTRAIAAHRLATGLFVLAPITALVLVACGGGGTGDMAGGQTAGGQAVNEGILTGFGSIFVNGIEYDVSTAKITDDLGNVASADALKLGMHVEVTGTDPTTTTPGSAEGGAGTVVYSSDIEGPVSAVDTSAGTITILDQTVDANPNTVWDPALVGGLAGLTVGEVIKVYSLYDSGTNQYVASRVESDTAATRYKIRGAVSNLDTTAKTYTIGSLPIDYSGVTNPPAGLADGSIATAELQTTEGANAWMATGVQLHNGGVAGNHVTVHVRGMISSESNPTFFVLDGWSVDASAANFIDGQSGIVPGAAVQVDGIMTNGALVATDVKLQKAGEKMDFQVHGPITAVDQSAQTFVLRGQTVSYAGNVAYSGGSSTDIAVGKGVFVQGTLAADGSSVQAATIKFTSGS